MSPSASPLIPVTLLTGFLGSGKTTVLNHLVRQPELADALVIINEFGEMSLDHMLVAHSTENLIMEMSSGCLCCTIRGDLVQTLRDVAWRFSREGQRQFRRVVIETTGLADPAPIVHTLMTHPQVANRYRLDGIVVTLDLATGDATLDLHPEAVRQAAIADCLLLTKADVADTETRDALMRRLAAINPAAPRWEVLHGEVSASKVLALGLFSTQGKAPDVERWLREEAYTDDAHSHGHTHVHHHGNEDGHGHDDSVAHHHHGHHHDINRHDDHIRAFCFAVDEPIPAEILAAWLDVLLGFIGADILRVKGILNIEGSDKPMVIHGVQHIFHPPATLPAWPSEDRRSRLVFITRDVSREAIEETFRAFHNVLPQAWEAAA
ncbi:CobW family GTP-binding protein [Castellaniella hirudinis]|uniref:CobW family GTP-binding protein n=1 Tax=Castellaniella hirudinis TaxID=1144617 RepID=A0ABV8RXY1_9BURK